MRADDEWKTQLRRARLSITNSRTGGVWLERTLVAIGISCLGYYGYQTTEARHFQQEQTRAFEALLAQQSGPLPVPSSHATKIVGSEVPSDGSRRLASERASRATSTSMSPRTKLPEEPPTGRRSAQVALDGVFALLEIPRLRLSSPVVSGDDGSALSVAVGHLPDTPKPWEPGNAAFAAHRDGLFRSLQRIRVGDEVRVRTQRGAFTYRVRETKIVEPEDLAVLAPTTQQSLTLITCYPFTFIGNAPQRFIVHADRVSNIEPIAP